MNNNIQEQLQGLRAFRSTIQFSQNQDSVNYVDEISRNSNGDITNLHLRNSRTGRTNIMTASELSRRNLIINN